MLAQIVEVERRRAVSVQVTSLSSDGHKLARTLMPGTCPHGSCIKLLSFQSILGIAEGVETALSATQMFGLPVWSAICADGLEKFEPPAGVEKLVVYGDSDFSYTGQASAYALAKRLRRRMEVEVVLPAEGHRAKYWVAKTEDIRRREPSPAA